jgi:hypothetical protein
MNKRRLLGIALVSPLLAVIAETCAGHIETEGHSELMNNVLALAFMGSVALAVCGLVLIFSKPKPKTDEGA